MAADKEPPKRSEREKTEPLRDSDLASEHQADANRDAERVEADEAKLQSRSDSDASRDLGRADAGRIFFDLVQVGCWEISSGSLNTMSPDAIRRSIVIQLRRRKCKGSQRSK